MLIFSNKIKNLILSHYRFKCNCKRDRLHTSILAICTYNSYICYNGQWCLGVQRHPMQGSHIFCVLYSNWKRKQNMNNSARPDLCKVMYTGSSKVEKKKKKKRSTILLEMVCYTACNEEKLHCEWMLQVTELKGC